ncbi:hypothetical protein [Streptomyces sp. NPDC056464]|uniref:hypothetical protein n=1 Tax=Streptomyces sp. NPDC056464 TaxID=3345828 RepID=UPI0036BA9C5B
MTSEKPHADDFASLGLPQHQALLAGTDWASLGTARGDGGFLPAALARLNTPDPAVQIRALRDLEPVCHGNSFYEATLPVALYIAAILTHPATATAGTEPASGYPVRAALLDWLGSLAYDADDEGVAIGERHFSGSYLDDYPEMRAFRDQRPTFYRAVSLFLGHEDTAVREAAVVAALPLVEHPDLTRHREELGRHAHHLLATSTNRYHRSRSLDVLRVWGHDTTALETTADIASRDHVGEGIWAGGCTEEPPF